MNAPLIFQSKANMRVTSDVEGVVSGYLALWGSPEQMDSYETWFDHENPPVMNLDFLPIALHYEHGMDEFIGKRAIGSINKIEVDRRGIKFEAQLDRTHPQFRRFVREIQNGEHGLSSGTMDYLATFTLDDRFENWPLGEVSLTKNPAESRMMETPAKILRSSTPTIEGDRNGRSPVATSEADNDLKLSSRQDKRMDPQVILDLLKAGATVEEIMAVLVEAGATPEQMQAFIDAMRGEVAPDETVTPEPVALAQDDDDDEKDKLMAALSTSIAASKATANQRAVAKTQADEMVALRAQVAALTNKIETEPPAPQNRHAGPPPDHTGHTPGEQRGGQQHITVGSRYDHLSASDMQLGYLMHEARRDIRGRTRPLSESYLNALKAKSVRAVETCKTDTYPSSLRSTIAQRADEVMNTEQTEFGAEWVGESFESTLWEKVRDETIWNDLVARGMEQVTIPRGSSKTTVPLEGADFVFYRPGQTTDVDITNRPDRNTPTSKMGTGKEEISTEKIAAVSYLSTEEDEDSWIDVLAATRRKYEVQAQEQIEYLIFNADTETAASTNINDVTGTPSTLDSFLIMNGILVNGLVTNTANSKDSLNAVNTRDLLALTKLLGPNGKYSRDQSKIMFTMDYLTQLAYAEEVELLTADVAGKERATLISGPMLPSIWNIDIFVSGQMELANDAGKIDKTTTSNNTRGRVALIRPDRFKLAWKRQIEFEMEKDIFSDVWGTVMRFRLGMGQFDNDGSAVLYNIKVG